MKKFYTVGSILVLTLGVFAFSAHSALAATRTATATGVWSATSTWGGNPVPVAGDNIIVNTGVTVTVDINTAAVTTIVLNAPATANGITISGMNTLNATGAITMTSPTANVTQTIAVGAGTLNAASIAIPGSNTTNRICLLSLSTGTVNVTGAITTSGTAAQSRITFTGAGTINVGGNFASGTFTASTGTMNFNGTGAQTIGDVAYNNLTTSGSGVKTLTLLANRTITGNLTIGSGANFTTAGNFTLGVTGATSITGTLTLGGTSAKTFTGNVTVNPGGVWNETAVQAVNYAGNLQNDGTTFTANTGTHTFSGATKTISGITAISIPTVIFTGNYTNNGTLTVGTSLTVTGASIRLTNNGTITATTSLAGTGGITQGATGTLNIGGTTSTITTLTATAVGNTVNYTGGAQTVKATTYSNLIFSGSGAKSMTTTGTSVSSTLSIAPTGSSTASVGAGLNLAVNGLTLGGVNKASGTWGGTGSGATHINTTYFAATTGKLNVLTGPTPSFSNITGSQSITYGTASVTLGGTVSASGPTYPANGEMVSVTINGVTQTSTIAGGVGGFSVNFPTASIPVSASPYTITYAYAGSENLNPATNNTSTTLTVEANLTAYNAALAAVHEADYTAASWTTYQGVVAANVVTVASTQAAVNTATANITAAQGSLVTVLAAAKVTAHDVLTAALLTYTEGDYTSDNWIALTGYKTDGDTAIDAAINLAGVTSAQNTAIVGMAGVKTIAQTAAEVLSNATNAVVVAETTPTQSNVDAAQSLVTALPDGADKTNLQSRIDAVQTIIDAATEAAAEASAETAISAYENALIDTLPNITLAEALKEPADSAVVLVLNPTVNAAFVARISNRANEIISAINALEAADKLAADQAAADPVTAQIAALPATDVLTLDNKAAVDSANAAFDALTLDQKTLVINSTLLMADVSKIADLQAAADKLAADTTAAQPVINQITALPAVADLILPGTEVSTARTAYDALTADQKILVSNYATLTAAEAQITTLQAAKDAADKLVADQAALAAAKVTAHSVLTTTLVTYTETNYIAENWIALTGFKTAGDAAIDAAATLEDVTAAQNTATAGMAGTAPSFLSLSLSGNSATVSDTKEVSTVSSGIAVTVNIPAGTIITGDSSWDGVLALPIATTTFTAPTPDSGFTAPVTAAIAIGAGDTLLTFDQAVKLTFAGQADKYVGWSRCGTFAQITDTCDTNNGGTTINGGVAFPDGGSCKISNDGSGNLIVWTKHFTTFITYALTAIPDPVSSGGGAVSKYYPPDPNFLTPTPISVPTSTPTLTPTPTSTPVVGQVLGATTFHFTAKLQKGSKGDDVTELQNRLTAEGVYSGPITGYFGSLTEASVKALQKKYSISAIGVVGPATMAKLNSSLVEAPAGGQVLGASTSAETEAKITALRTQMTTLMTQLLKLLQEQAASL
ncbi:MAG: peptidoglycan-binding protein [Minisyncoccia bacterium]